MKPIKIGPIRIGPHTRNGKPTGKFQISIPKRIYGRRHRPLFDTVNDAIFAAKKIQQAFKDGRLQEMARERAAPAVISFFECLRRWLEEQDLRVRTLKKRPSSLERDMNHFKSAKAFLGDVPINQITAKRLAEYQADRLAKGMKPPTINSDVVAICKVLRWAHREELLPKVPVVERLPISRKAPEVPNMAEVARIIRALPAKVRVLGRLLAETGCRRGEAFNLRWEDVDLKRGVIHIRSKEGWTPKTAHSEREIPIGRELLGQLQRMAKQNASAKEKASDYVFPGPDPKKPRTLMKRVFKSALKKANITRNGKPLRITVHTLRKAYATWAAIEKGVPPRVLQALLGHAPGSSVTDQWYIGIPADALRKGINELPL